jgi:phenylacetate-CoA ligase
MVRMTGGSTSKPVRIPAWKSESDATRWEVWLGRTWYGVRPESRLFLLWGHSHLLGTGWTGWLRARRRELSDRLLGYRRHSAYDVSAAAMRRAADALAEFRPDYVVGYSVALDLLARANEGRGHLRELNVKAIFGTAEAFPDATSAARLQGLFGCPVGMEYGAVETGVMAHTHPAGGYRVFWRHHLLEAAGSGPRRRLLVTSLFPRAFPLIRYEIGDEVVLPEAADESAGLTTLASVAGRCNDYVELSDGTLVHSEAFSHAVRPCSAIRSFQVIDRGSAVSIRFTSNQGLTSEEQSGITTRLARVHPQLGSAQFERSESLEQTVAGKTRMIVHI